MKIPASITAALLGCCAGGALAQSPQDRDFYVGVDLGQARIGRDGSQFESAPGSDRQAPAWKLRLGYRLTRILSVEANYTDFGGYDAREFPFTVNGAAGGASLAAPGDLRTSATGMGISAVAEWPLGETFHLNASAGLLRREFRTHYAPWAQGQPGTHLSDGDLGFQFGIGAGFAVSESFDIGVEWLTTSNLEGDMEFRANAADPSLLSLSLRFRL